MNDLITSPSHVLTRLNGIEGWELVPKSNLPETILETVQEWSDDWSEGQGFGSSDMTFLLKSCIDRLICGTDLKTVFSPRLSIVKS